MSDKKNMSNQNSSKRNGNTQEQTQQEFKPSNKEYIAPETLAFDAWVNASDGEFMKLPPNDGGTIVAKFSKDKGKRRLVQKTFTDQKTGKDTVSIKAEYMVIDPNGGLDQSEKKLEVPRTLAAQIEKNLERNHTMLEITRSGTGISTRYMVVAA